MRKWRQRRDAGELRVWAHGLSDEQLSAALSDEPQEKRLAAAVELCRRHPGRPVEEMVTALRGTVAPVDYNPPDARELLELGLQNCRCTGLRRVELFCTALSDPRADAKLRGGAAWGLVYDDDPQAWEALQTAATDPDRRVRSHVKQVLRVKRTLQAVPPEAREQVLGSDTRS